MLGTWRTLVRMIFLGCIAVGLSATASAPATAQEAVPQTTIRVYPLKYIRVNWAAELFSDVLGVETLRISFDERTNSLIVSAMEADHLKIMALIESLDEPSENDTATKTNLPPVQVRVIWLASGVQGNALPKGLEPVVKELEDLGIADLSLAGQMMINVGEPAEPFSIESRPRLGEESFDLAFRGTLSTSPSGVPRMHAAIVCSLVTGEKIANVASTIETPLDQYIVLGTTVADGSNSVFVLQLMRQSSAKSATKQ